MGFLDSFASNFNCFLSGGQYPSRTMLQKADSLTNLQEPESPICRDCRIFALILSGTLKGFEEYRLLKGYWAPCGAPRTLYLHGSL